MIYPHTHITNLYPLIIENLEQELAIIFLKSNVFNFSTSHIVSQIRKSLSSKDKKLYQKSYLGLSNGGHIVILSSSDDYTKKVIDMIHPSVFKDRNTSMIESKRLYEFNPQLKKFIFQVISRSVEDYIFKILSSNGWTILFNKKIFMEDDKRFMIPIEDQRLSDIVKLYKGLRFTVISVEAEDAFGSMPRIICASPDYTIIIKVTKSLGALYNDYKIIYKERKATKEEQIQRFWYKAIKNEVWNIERIMYEDSKKAKVYRFKKEGKTWNLIQKELSVDELYPIGRPEIIDSIAIDMGIQYKLTKKVKQESFQITQLGKRDREASKKRFFRTREFVRIISEIVQRSSEKYLGKFNIKISEDTLPIFVS